MSDAALEHPEYPVILSKAPSGAVRYATVFTSWCTIEACTANGTQRLCLSGSHGVLTLRLGALARGFLSPLFLAKTPRREAVPFAAKRSISVVASRWRPIQFPLVLIAVGMSPPPPGFSTQPIHPALATKTQPYTAVSFSSVRPKGTAASARHPCRSSAGTICRHGLQSVAPSHQSLPLELALARLLDPADSSSPCHPTAATPSFLDAATSE